LLLTAPEPARANIREALVATERGRALVAAPRPEGRDPGGANARRSSDAAVVPTVAAETFSSVASEPTAVPLPSPVNQAVDRHQEDNGQAHRVEPADVDGRRASIALNPRSARPAVPSQSELRGGRQSSNDDRDGGGDEATVAPPEVAREAEVARVAEVAREAEVADGDHGDVPSSTNSRAAGGDQRFVAPVVESDTRGQEGVARQSVSADDRGGTSGNKSAVATIESQPARSARSNGSDERGGSSASTRASLPTPTPTPTPTVLPRSQGTSRSGDGGRGGDH